MLEARMEELEEKTARQDAVAKSQELQTRNSIDSTLKQIDKEISMMPKRIRDMQPKEEKVVKVDDQAFQKDIGDSWSEVDQAGAIDMEDLAEEGDKAEEMEDRADEFEEGAMFTPMKRGFAFGNKYDVDSDGPDIDLSEVSYAVDGDFGGKDKKRRNNENLYNHEGYVKHGIVDMEQSEYKEYMSRIGQINSLRQA